MFSPGLSFECFCIEILIQWNNLMSYCGLVDAKIRASDKDLPVLLNFLDINKNFKNLISFSGLVTSPIPNNIFNIFSKKLAVNQNEINIIS